MSLSLILRLAWRDIRSGEMGLDAGGAAGGGGHGDLH